MPIDPGTATILSAGLGTGQGVLGMIQNRQNRKWSEKMMNRQREWALADWNMQNEFNSPRAQMARLQEAGLNPMLVYGNGVQGATGNAGNVRSSGGGDWQGQTPDFSGLQNSLFAGVNLEQRRAQVDLLEKQATIAIQTAALQAAKTGESLAKTAKTRFDLEMAQSLKNVSLQTAEENLRKLQVGNRFQLDENERRNALAAGNLAQAAERIILMRAQTATTQQQAENLRATLRNIRLDGDIKQLDKELRENGIYPDSPWWIKTLESYLDKQTGGKPFGGDLEWIPKSPSSDLPGETGYPRSAKPKNWYKWK